MSWRTRRNTRSYWVTVLGITTRSNCKTRCHWAKEVPKAKKKFKNQSRVGQGNLFVLLWSSCLKMFLKMMVHRLTLFLVAKAYSNKAISFSTTVTLEVGSQLPQQTLQCARKIGKSWEYWSLLFFSHWTSSSLVTVRSLHQDLTPLSSLYIQFSGSIGNSYR